MSIQVFPKNMLFYGDNLDVLQGHFPSECIDLIYLDPPFNSKAEYNVLFRKGQEKSQLHKLKHLAILGHGTNQPKIHI